MSHIDAAVTREIGRAVGRPIEITGRRLLGGGCINRTERLDTTAGAFVLKSNPSAPPGFFRAEADGLDALRASGTTLTIPRVIACSSEAPQWLALEYLGAPAAPGAAPLPDFDERLGRGLALLHQTSARTFGFRRDNFCGLTPQPNPPRTNWAAFYGEARLGHQLRLARAADLVTLQDSNRIEIVISRLREWIPEPPNGPALIHGDLWSGNLHVDAGGCPAVLDPAAYYAHREAEFGIMTLFGGFSARVFDAYSETSPFEPGWRDRNPLYQLYHLLNHLNLFGGSYHEQVMNVVRRFV